MAGTPFTPRVSLAGVSETSWSGAAVADGWPVPPGLEFLPVADDCADACVNVIQMPAASKSTMAPAMATTRLGRLVRKDNNDSLARRHCPADRCGRAQQIPGCISGHPRSEG